MILVDTSVWVEHLSRTVPPLKAFLEHGDILIHPFVRGEIALGDLKNRQEILDLLAALPAATEVSDEEVLYFIDHYKLYGRGIGWVDVHLLASAQLMGRKIWTLDKSLVATAKALKIHCYSP